MYKKILITGASGLLGQALVDLFSGKGFFVLGQYHKRKPADREGCRWLPADFSNLAGIRDFLQTNRQQFKECRYLINNYGPITYKESRDLQAEDFVHDFHHNVITAVEMTAFFIAHSQLEAVVNIGFEFIGEINPYRKILSYAAAKNALLLITESFAKTYPHIRFHMVNPRTLAGAAVKPAKKNETESPAQIAQKIYQTLLSQR